VLAGERRRRAFEHPLASPPVATRNGLASPARIGAARTSLPNRRLWLFIDVAFCRRGFDTRVRALNVYQFLAYSTANPFVSFSGFAQGLNESLPIAVVAEDRFAPVPATQDVVDGSRILDA